ncbi:MAG: PfkB family carbohydrate kinase [bacterium]
MNLLIVGTVAFDSVETPYGKVERVLGGSGTYAGCAASFFTAPMLAGVVGEDFPDEYFDLLRLRGIDTEGVVRESGKTFHWAGKYETDVNVRTTLLTELNVLEKFDPILPDRFRDVKYLFLANTDPNIQLKVMDQCGKLEFTVLDTMNYWIENTRDALDKALDRADCVLLNDEEARMLCGTPVLRNAARAILEGHPRVVIIKKGEHGVMMFTKDSFFMLPGFPLEVVKDPTGAGDSFAGGFIGWLAAKDRIDETALRQAVAAGSATASFCCEDFSVDRFRRLEIEELTERSAAFGALTMFEPLVMG